MKHNHGFSISIVQIECYLLQKVYCGHEYSIQNLTFGLHVEPNNKEIQEKLKWCKTLRGENPAKPTIPSTIGKHR